MQTSFLLFAVKFGNEMLMKVATFATCLSSTRTSGQTLDFISMH